MTIPRGMIPREPIREALMEYVKGEQSVAYGIGAGDAVLALAIRSKVSPGTIDNLLSTKRDLKFVDFDLADRLLCSAGLVHLWNTRLHDIYAAADLSQLSKTFRAWEPEYEDLVCEECEEEFSSLLNDTRGGKSRKAKRYCSPSCGAMPGGRARAENIYAHGRPGKGQRHPWKTAVAL